MYVHVQGERPDDIEQICLPATTTPAVRERGRIGDTVRGQGTPFAARLRDQIIKTQHRNTSTWRPGICRLINKERKKERTHVTHSLGVPDIKQEQRSPSGDRSFDQIRRFLTQ
jgi:hypothetical protein